MEYFKKVILFLATIHIISCSKDVDLNDYVGVYDATVIKSSVFIYNSKLTIDNQGGSFSFYCPENIYGGFITIKSIDSKTFSIDFQDNGSGLKYDGSGIITNDHSLTLTYRETYSNSSGRDFRIIATR
jgi:hypothetical protein